ncbi:HD-GYP domain-containing protein [Pseudoteredinibacter isoporae]|uniref:HD-GYP domain-containing protein (C-di-GMP phosphodiesterase class II) n=1 Tax=Pseudoteredinibacter isoporae TaxID=570281 RepID=A0A7X0JUH0_9GAMM|nr:HD-GYP domain-containing protein [Pseudoteredinibacter isoporae]MBB6522493.1 HD-GYP domain-containing protein (c-di-GMP phosphodiesterase class II) [Pseudoteredinibacter isoporae]NHO88022.1 HD-GYP domain-containing protein [Pseudoteredinibacter isoporae]NIB23647.1 HD-GYP domain-containing protein [Pseudoteredinibacter isoporae]
MRLLKVQAENLRPGMFVAELDRPWLDTPFALQGFVVQDPEEVVYIGRYVDYVYIDADYAGSNLFLPKRPKQEETVKDRLSIKAEFEQARTSFTSASESLDRVFNALNNGVQTDIQVVRESVQPLIDGVFNNKEAMAVLVRLKESSDYRYQHGVSMAVWAAILGRHIGLPVDELEKLVIGCAMCDVGMTRLPDEIFQQTGGLSDYQRQMVELHTHLGSQMVDENGNADLEILSIIKSHHERMDGSGYPDGLKGSDIPLFARIAGLVDAYDAMITPRPYAPGVSSYDAIQELIQSKGVLFQDALVEQFVQAIGLFPTGSLVELNTGEVGIVVKQNDIRRLKPEVVIVLDKFKRKLDSLRLVDLAREDVGNISWIVQGLRPGSYDVNSEEYFI